MRRAGVALLAMVVVAVVALGPALAQQGKIELLWLGQAAVRLTSANGKVIVIDPFLTNNPKTPQTYKNLDALGKVDLILVTHGHGDHIGDAPELAKKHNVPMIAPAGLNHMGDTGIFGDMRWIGEYYKPDLILIPIGGHFVMSPQDAAVATRDFFKPKHAIPIHYGTFPVLRGTPEEYIKALGSTTTKVHAINPGDKLTF